MIHDRAAILSIGDELVLGQTLDTNAQWLSERLADLNIRVIEHITIPDDLDAHIAALRRLAAAAPLLISTGGLGPTLDDLTRHALAAVLGEKLVTDEPELRHIESLFTRRGRPVTDLQRTQSQRPASASMLHNANGTAPGLAAHLVGPPGCDIFCLPGPPNEMKPMFESIVRPMLRPPQGKVVRTRVLHTLGLGEGDLAIRLGSLMNRDRNPLVGTTASGGVVSCRVRYEGPPDGADSAMAETERLVRSAAAPFIFGEADATIMSSTIDLLRQRDEKLVVAESCTGGLLGSLLTSIAGSSDVFLGGWITYANEFKSAEVNVPEALLREHGAVSEPVARAMAEGALRAAPGNAAHHALAITGIAGPGGGSETKPVGTVFIALASRPGSPSTASRPQTTEVRRFLISGGRDGVRDRSAKLALAMLRFRLMEQRVDKLLWEVS